MRINDAPEARGGFLLAAFYTAAWLIGLRRQFVRLLDASERLEGSNPSAAACPRSNLKS